MKLLIVIASQTGRTRRLAEAAAEGAAAAGAEVTLRGAEEATDADLLAYLAENGCLLVPFHNRLAGFRDAGCHWGVLAQTGPGPAGPGPTDADCIAAHAQGRFLAECAARWNRGS